MEIVALDHVALTVADPEETAAFYEQFGMRREALGDGRIALHFGQQKFNLHRAGRELAPHARAPLPGSADVCLLVDGELGGVERELRSAGVAIEVGPVERDGATGRLRSVYVRDPDGNLVELAQRLPG